MKRFLLLAVGCGTLCLAGGASPAGEPQALPWKAGAASVKITPQSPIWMAGYAARKKPSEGVAADLFAKALAIEDEAGRRLVIVTMDLIGVPRPLRDWLEARVRESHGLPGAALLLNASHTHCGPELRLSKLEGDQEKAAHAGEAARYAGELQEKLVTVTGEALKRLQPAKLEFLRARAGFAMNRRRPVAQGFSNAPNFEGPVDHEVPVLRVSDVQGAVKALLFGYACHNTTMGDYLIRGDYAGYAQQYLEEEHAGAVALFLTGCGADQNPYPRGKEEQAKQHGRTLALAVEAALQTVPRPLGGPLAVAFQDVELEFAPVPPKEELEKTAASQRVPDAGHARRLLKEWQETGKVRTTYACPVQVVRFGGDLILVALGGEVVVDYSLRLKRELAGPAVWVAGYSNDVFGYLPSLRVLREGGYEGGQAMQWGSLPGPFTETVEDRVMSKVLEMAQGPAEALRGE